MPVPEPTANIARQATTPLLGATLLAPVSSQHSCPQSTLQACHTPCRRMCPEDIFVSLCEAVWPHLSTEYGTRKCVRSACRHGLRLHDRLSTCLTLDLSKMTHLRDTDIRSAVSGMMERGSKFRIAELTLSTGGARSRLGEQL